MLWILFSCCCVFPFFQCGDFGHLSLTCTKPADTSKSNAHCDWLDGSSLTTDDADAQQVECDFLHLLSSCSNKFSVKGGSNGVKGRLKPLLNFWVETLDASDFVLDMIRCGYRLPFAQYPSQCFLKNNRSTLQHPEFVAEAITELLSNCCIVEHVVLPFCVNPLTVTEGKKLRLVIDLRHVNNCLVKPKFKYDDLRSLSRVLDEGHWFFTRDLKSGYHHFIFVLITKSILVLLGLFPALLDILPLQFFLSALVVPAFVLLNWCAR